MVFFSAIGCGRGDDELAAAAADAAKLLKAGKLEEAEAAYAKLVERRPDSSHAQANLAFVKLELGKLEEAASRAKRALEIEPGMVEALTTLGNAYLRSGPESEELARESLEKAVAASGGRGAAEARATLAAIYYRRRNLDAAIANARAALAADATLGEAKYNLAVALEAEAETMIGAGRTGEALRLRREALGHFRSFAKGRSSGEAEEARRAIGRLGPLVGDADSGTKGETGSDPEP